MWIILRRRKLVWHADSQGQQMVVYGYMYVYVYVYVRHCNGKVRLNLPGRFLGLTMSVDILNSKLVIKYSALVHVLAHIHVSGQNVFGTNHVCWLFSVFCG